MEFLKKLLGAEFKEDLTLAQLDPMLKAHYEALEAEKAKYKTASEKNSQEAADYKAKYKAGLNDAEKAKLEREELETQIKALTKEADISKHTSKYVTLGYDGESALKAATALVEGNTDSLFEIMREHDTKMKADIDAKNLENTPKPPAGDKKAITKEDFLKMNYEEMSKFAETNPNEYAEFIK